MAGAATTITEQTSGRVMKVIWAWTSDSASGAVSGTTTKSFTGRCIGLTTIPSGGGTAPTASYDIAITDADGHDVLLGAGVDRHTSNTEHVTEGSLAGIASSKLTLAVTNAGNSKLGTAILYIEGAAFT
jgi:hypothetical protein